MELKRYVLVNKPAVFEGSIVDTKIAKHLHIYENDVIKTSDNILDLVEVGDLVAEKVLTNSQLDSEGFRGNQILQVITLANRENRDNLSRRFFYNGGAVEDVEITAIFKLTPKGDYKRYEVKS